MTTESAHTAAEEDHESVRHHFDDELDSLRNDAVGLGALVLENLKRASEAITENDLELARTTIDADREVNRRYVEMEQRVFGVLVRQQPVASDLRLLVSLTRILYELERTGDLVVNCAKALLRGDGFDLQPSRSNLLTRMLDGSAHVFAKGLDALSDMDAEAGAEVDIDDDAVDALVGEWFEGLAEDAEAVGLDSAILMSRLGRFLERIADHGVNIGQHVVYIVTGEFPPEHEEG